MESYLQGTRTPAIKVELARWCWQRESRRSSAEVWVTAVPAQIVTVAHLYWLFKPVCCFGNKEAMHRESTSDKALCSQSLERTKTSTGILAGILVIWSEPCVTLPWKRQISSFLDVILMVMCLQWVQQSAHGTNSETSSNFVCAGLVRWLCDIENFLKKLSMVKLEFQFG